MSREEPGFAWWIVRWALLALAIPGGIAISAGGCTTAWPFRTAQATRADHFS